MFVIGSAYYCAASYPTDRRFEHVDHDDIGQSRKMSNAIAMTTFTPQTHQIYTTKSALHDDVNDEDENQFGAGHRHPVYAHYADNHSYPSNVYVEEIGQQQQEL